MAVVNPRSRQISINSFIAIIAALVVGLFVSPANADRVVYTLGDDIPATISGDATSGDLELNAVNGEIIYTGTVSDVSSTVPTNLYATGTWGTDSGARVNLRGAFPYTGVSTVDCYVLVFKGNGSNTSITSAGFAGNGKIAIEGVNGTNNRNMTLSFTADPSTPQPHTGIFQINGATRLNLPTDANLGKSTLRMIGGSSNYYTEMGFNGVAKTVSFNDVITTNGYARVMNLNDSIAADDLNTLSLKSGTFSGELGRMGNGGADLPGKGTAKVNYFNLTKASDGTADGGTLTLSGPVYYRGETNIESGTLAITGSDFVTSSALTGSGTLKLSGNNRYFNIASNTPSDFTGTVQIADSSISGNTRIKLAAATYSWSNNALQTTYSATDVNLPKATLLLDGNTSGKYAEFAFQYKDSDLTIGTLQGNGYARVLNTDGNTTSATYCTLTVGNGNYAGEIGRRENENLYPFTNYINLVKADDGSADGGTLTLSNDYMLYVGTTTIEGGTLEITNTNSSDGYRQIFTRSTALNGSGTLDFTGKGWTVFSINTADTTTPQEFTGTVNVGAGSKVMIKSEGSPVKDLNLGNATLHLDQNANVGLHGNGGVASALTVKELNSETGSTVRVCSASPNAGNYGVLTVGKGTVNGNIGVADDNYYNMVSLVKASDGSADGGTLTIKGNLYYTGPTVIDGGTLRFENNTGNYKYFQRSTALNGSGTLELEGNDWIGFSINASADEPQEFTGSVNVLSNTMIRTSGATKPLNLGNGTINVAENVILGMHVNNGAISNLTVKELNTEPGSTVRLCSNNPGTGKFGTLTVGSGTVNGNLGEANNTNTWYNWVNLVKVSDGSDDGGTLTINGNNYYTGTTTIQAGTLKLASNGSLGSGDVNFVQEKNSTNTGTLEFAHTSDQTFNNDISGAGNVTRSGSGVVTLSGALTYTGTTTINDGTTLKFVNNNDSNNNNFINSTALAGAGTFDFVGNSNSWIVFSINANASSPQDFSGVLKATGNMVFYKDANLGNATLQVGDFVYDDNGDIVYANNEPQYKKTTVTFRGVLTENLTFKELNTLPNSTVRVSHAAPSQSAIPVLTVGSGTVEGNLGETNANNPWYNWVNLVKVSDGSDDGGTLTLSGTNLYTGSIDVQAGTLKLTGDATLSKGATTIGEDGTLEFEVADDEKQVTITAANPISGAGKIVKSGPGILIIDNTDFANYFSVGSIDVNGGELKFKGNVNGDIDIFNDAVFSPGISIETLDITGNVSITNGTALFKFGQYTGLDENHDVLNILGADNVFTAGNGMISLAFDGDPNAWAAEGSPYMLVSNGGFTEGGDYSQWLSSDYSDLFSLIGRNNNLYLVAGAGPGPGPDPGSGVPEPSTWALMALGVVVLFLRKRK